MRMYRLSLLVLLAACSSAPPSPGPRVQGALDYFAPDLTIGAPVRGTAHIRYRMLVTPYLGYRDPLYRTPEGMAVLSIQVDEIVDDGNRKVSDRARIVSVFFEVPDSATMKEVRAKLVEVLGEPNIQCYAHEPSWKWKRLYWRGEHGRGAMLTTALGPDSASPNDTGQKPPRVGSGMLSFGVPDMAVDASKARPCEGR